MRAKDSNREQETATESKSGQQERDRENKSETNIPTATRPIFMLLLLHNSI